jgi:3-oxoadipate enol-lactonase
VDERGAHEFEALVGAPPGEVPADIRAASPEMYDGVVSRAFGTVANPDLDGGTRELVTHVAAAVRLGVTQAELLALCEHVSVYAGFPRPDRGPPGRPRPRRGRTCATGFRPAPAPA